MAWKTVLYQKLNTQTDGLQIRIRVHNEGKREEYETLVDAALTEDEILDVLAAGIKEKRNRDELMDSKLNTTTLEGKINALP